MPKADVNGQTLYYEVHGEGEPLLCVMGLSADSLAWILQVKPFAARHRTVIFDNRDVGRSSMAEGSYEIADMARDTLALADALELDEFHLLGVSMGGAISQELALTAPERVRTLTLAVTWPGSGGWARVRSRHWGARNQKLSKEERVDELMLLTMSEEFFEDEEAAARMREVMLSHPHFQPADAFARQLDASSRHDARERLTSLQMPVHVIGAEHDMLVPVWKSRELAELVPGAKLTVIEGAPHGLQIERRAEFNSAVLDFIADQARAPV